jgi:endoglucanase
MRIASSVTSSTTLPAVTAAIQTGSVTASITASVTGSITASVTESATIGGELWAGGGGQNHGHHSSHGWQSASASAWNSATASETGASTTASSPTTKPTSTSTSGYLQTSGTAVVDSNNNVVNLKGTNLGGWLVLEDWMCGITDNSGSGDRFAQTTLENRFGVDATWQLIQTWQDNWLVASDFDNIASLGFNVVRLPFSYRNFVWPNGSYVTDSNGDIDFSRLDWAVAQAKSRGIYVIPTYHIWDGQADDYSAVSEDTSKGQSQRDLMGTLWGKIATHFLGETTIAAYDAINEPTGSANNKLQRDLYNSIRAADPARIIIMESINAAPDSDWTNVMYSLHEYLMMGSDTGYNQNMWNTGAATDVSLWQSWNVPVYVGEFMADAGTLSWMLSQINGMSNVWWSGWTYKTVNMGRWGLWNTAGFSVDVQNDDWNSINNQWSSSAMSQINQQAVASQYQSACGSGGNQKRESEEGEKGVKRFNGHGGRSRRFSGHGVQRVGVSF